MVAFLRPGLGTSRELCLKKRIRQPAGRPPFSSCAPQPTLVTRLFVTLTVYALLGPLTIRSMRWRYSGTASWKICREEQEGGAHRGCEVRSLTAAGGAGRNAAAKHEGNSTSPRGAPGRARR